MNKLADAGHGWTILVQKLMSLRVPNSAKACERALENGATVQSVGALIEHYKANADMWTPADLAERISIDNPSLNPGAKWPSPRVADGPSEPVRQQKPATKTADKKTAKPRTRRKKKPPPYPVPETIEPKKERVRPASDQTRESQYGEQLDALSAAEVVELAGELGFVGRAILKTRECDRKRIHRVWLLDALAARERR